MFAVTNRIQVEAGHGTEMETVFGHRGGVEKEQGFCSFELWKLEASEDHDEYLVVTRWETEEAYNAWTKSDSFKRAHAGAPPSFILGPGQINKFDVRIAAE